MNHWLRYEERKDLAKCKQSIVHERICHVRLASCAVRSATNMPTGGIVQYF